MIPLYFPINSTSLGASAFHIFEAIKGECCLFPLGGGVDVSSFEPLSAGMAEKLNKAIQDGLERHKTSGTSIKLWHQFEGYTRITADQILYSFHELNALTPIEVNSLQQQKAIIVPCQFNKEIFEKYGLGPVYVVPLGVDRSIFYPLEKYKNKNDTFVFTMMGKFEARKMHIEILQAFMAVFANNPKVKLRCCIANRFIDMKKAYQMISERVFRGQQVSNVEFIDWMPTERHVADFISSGDCLITPSRGESFNLPLLQAMSCGCSVITNADHAHKDYVTSENAHLIPSEGLIDARDDVFFRMDGKTNTGQWFNINPNHIAQAMIEVYKVGRKVNEAGIETAKSLSWDKTADGILKVWDSNKT